MNAWFTIALVSLRNDPAVWILAGSIVAGALMAYLWWYSPATIRLLKALQELSRALSLSTDGWTVVKERALSAAKQHPVVQTAWLQTEERVIPLAQQQNTIFVMFGAPRDLWNSNRLLSRSFNLQLAEAVPNLLVGLGLLFTFFFLTLALTQATTALLPQGEQQLPSDLTSATRGLLSAAGAKFLTSLAGLFASIVWAIASRRRMAQLQNAIEEVLERIGGVVLTSGGEVFLYAQLQTMRELQDASQKQIGTTETIAGRAGQNLELMEELLNEVREQSGTFKRFETDLAVSLAGAITSAFSPQMEAMTDRLIGAINGLSDKIGTMNQQALQRMMEDFAAMLKKSTESEMTHLRETLEMLANRLTGAGQAIDSGAGKAADRLDKAGADLLARVEQVSASLVAGATNLEGATQGVKEAMNDLDVTISQAAELGKQGSSFARDSLETAESILERLKSVATELSATSNAFGTIGGQLVDAVDSVEEITIEQRAVVNAVKEATPQAMASVQRVLELLQQTVQSTATTMAQTKDAMASTSRTLGTTVAEITAGVSEYSKTVAALHRRMDEQLAKAVGSLDKGVTGLEEAIEELGEVLSSQTSKS